MEFNKQKITERLLRNSPDKWKLMGFAMLPTKLLFDDRLKIKSSLLVFWVLTVHIFKGKDCCYPSLETIATEAHCSKPTAIKAIKELENLGYLQIDRVNKSNGKSNKYYLKAY